MNLRYAILHHTGVAAPHFDLMFETAPGSALATWRCPAWPVTSPATVERLADHRPAYLQYEGPVRGGRGEIRRVAGGTFDFESRADDKWVVVTDEGTRLTLARRGDAATWSAEVGQTG